MKESFAFVLLLNKYLLGHCLVGRLTTAFYRKTKSASRCRISIDKNKYDANKIFYEFKVLVLARTLLLWSLALQAYLLLKLKLIHLSAHFSMTARIAEPSHYFIITDLSKIRGIIYMQFNFDSRAMR